MKWIFGFVVLLPCCLSSSPPRSELGNMYETAYRYIEASQELHFYCRAFLKLDAARCVMAVADTTVLMEYAMYAPELARATEGEDRLAVIKSVMDRDQARAQAFEPIPVGRMLHLEKSQPDAPLSLFFANMFDNALMVRVLGDFGARKSYRELTQFNTGVTFLFFFDDAGRITRVVEGVTHYD